jgi:protein TonB
MFEDSLLESGGTLARRNPWTTAFSFAVQLAIGGALVLLSMMYTDVLPMHTLISTLEAPPSPPAGPAPPEPRAATATPRVSELHDGALMTPQKIPNQIVPVDDAGETHSGAECSPCVVGAPPGTGGSPIPKLLDPTPAVAPKAAVPQKVRVSSGVAQGMLIRQVRPQYPPLAQKAHIQGAVVLQAVIGKDGSVEDLRVISGHPLLTAAAIDAVRQWLYKPYTLNGEPVSVDTQISVNFTLANE